MKILTIAVPAYNAEEYLDKCLRSLVLDDVELMAKVQVIVVNDGSKDGTLRIAKEYAAKYPDTFEVIDKANGNYGSCMNAALKVAKGKYFRTLDSDDWFDTKGYGAYLEELEKTDADMLLSERTVFYSLKNETNYLTFDDNVVVDKDIPISDVDWENTSIRKNIFVSAISYKTSLIRESGLTWSEGVFYTDNEFDYFPTKLVKTIRFMRHNVYIYWVGREGQSIQWGGEKTMHSYEIVTLKVLRDFIDNGNKSSAIYPYQLYLVFYHLVRVVYNLGVIRENPQDYPWIETMDKMVQRHSDLNKHAVNDVRMGKFIKVVPLFRKHKVFYRITMKYFKIKTSIKGRIKRIIKNV